MVGLMHRAMHAMEHGTVLSDQLVQLADEAKLRGMTAEELAEDKHLSPLMTLFLMSAMDK